MPPLAQRIADLLAQGLSEEDLGPDLATTSTTTTTAPPTTTSAATTSSTTTTSTTTTTLPPEEVLAGEIGGNRITVLLAGGDFGPGRSDLRTDVMIVAVLDLDTGKAALISVSRDLVQAPLPASWSRFTTMLQVQQWHEDRAYQEMVDAAVAAGTEPPEKPAFVPCDCYFDRINYLHVHTANWVVTFPDAPDPGMEALRQTLEVTLGLPIDYYALVDFAGFVDLVDAVGGIDVNSREEMHLTVSPAKEGEEWIAINITPGRQHLDGRTALAYVRNRTGSSDGQRMLRQRCLLRDLASEMDAATILTRFTLDRPGHHHLHHHHPPPRPAPRPHPGGGRPRCRGHRHRGHRLPRLDASALNYMGLPIIDAAKARATVAGVLAGLSAEGGGEGGEPAADECG